MRGRKPKPIAQRISEGDPGKHGVNKLRERLAAEVQASKGFGVCPEHLKARAAWWRANDLQMRDDETRWMVQHAA